MKDLRLIIAIAAIIALVSLTGCTSSAGSQDQTTANQTGSNVEKLTIGTTNAVTGVNIVDDSFAKFRARLVSEGLVTMADNGSFMPCLAESWESPNASTWIFHLRKNVTWQDGVPLTAKDIGFNLEYFPSKIAEYKQHWGQIASVVTPDDYTVIISLNTPNGNFLTNLMVMRAIPEHVFANVTDPKSFNDANAIVGTGPYRFTGFDKDAGILTFVANDNYWGGKPSVGTIEIHVYKSQDTMVMALKKGDIDTTYMYSTGINYYYVPALLQDEDVSVDLVNSTGVTALFFNTEKPVLNNATFRKAVSYALDYNEILNLLAAGYAEPGTISFLPAGYPNYKDNGLMALNINKSKELLVSIGMIDRDGDGFREAPDGSKFQLELLTRNDNADYPRLSELVKKYLSAAGIDVKIKLVDTTTFQKYANTDKTFDALISRTTPWGMMTWCGYGSCYFDYRNIGYTVTKDPAYTKLVDQMFNATDAVAQKEIASQMQDYFASQMPALALYSSKVIQPYNKEYEGWASDPMYGILSNGTFYNLHKAA